VLLLLLLLLLLLDEELLLEEEGFLVGLGVGCSCSALLEIDFQNSSFCVNLLAMVVLSARQPRWS